MHINPINVYLNYTAKGIRVAIVEMLDFSVANDADIINCRWGAGLVNDIAQDKLQYISKIREMV